MSETAIDPARRRRILAAVIAMISIVGLALGLTMPLLSLVLESRHVPGWLNGLNAAVAALANVVLSPFVPGLMRRFGNRRFLALCLVLSVAALPALRLFDSLAAWFGLRFLLGATLACLFVASEIWLSHFADDKSRGRLLGLYSTVLSAAFAVGALVISLTGTQGWLPFLLGAGVLAAAGAPLLLLGADMPNLPSGAGSLAASLRMLRMAPVVFLAALVYATIEVGLFGLLPVYGVRAGLAQSAAVTLATVAIAGNMVAQFPMGWWADRSDPRTVLKICALAGALGVAVVPLLVGGPFLWPALFVWAGMMGGLYIVGLTLVTRSWRGPDMPAANAAYVMIYGVGMLVGPPIGGWAMDQWNPHGLIAAASGFYALYLVLLLLQKRKLA